MSHQLPDVVPDARPSGALLALWSVSSAVTTALLGLAVYAVIDDEGSTGTLARATGITAYLLLVALVVVGLLLSHPKRARWRRPSNATRIRVHASLAAFTLVFVLLHLVLWATSSTGGVGWAGALIPMQSSFRTVFVTFGVLGLYSGAAAGLAAAFAGHLSQRVWWPVHKLSLLSLVLIWLHVLGGADARRLLGLYAVTAALVLGLAIWRYAARPVRHGSHRLARHRAHELDVHHRRRRRAAQPEPATTETDEAVLSEDLRHPSRAL